MLLQCLTVFDVDFKRITKEVFWGENLPNLNNLINGY